MLSITSAGLHSRVGNFHIDPMRAVENAVITHAHSDHARRGSRRYFTASTGVELLKARLGNKIEVTGVDYGKQFLINGIKLSFHPAGHILGSAQVRIEFGRQVWVASGDYKRDSDPTCEPFEIVPCDVFITEATFGTPAYTWEKDVDLGKEIFEWWQKNAAQKINSILFAYSLGKAQRILGVLAPYAKKPIYCHPATSKLNDCYRAAGIRLAETYCLSGVAFQERLVGELLITPQNFLSSEQAQILGGRFVTAFASGWMSQSKFGYGDQGYDRGFVMSDHADWNDLVRTISETKAKRVYVQHRGQGALVKYLRSLGIEAFPDSALAPPISNQLSLF